MFTRSTHSPAHPRRALTVLAFAALGLAPAALFAGPPAPAPRDGVAAAVGAPAREPSAYSWLYNLFAPMAAANRVRLAGYDAELSDSFSLTAVRRVRQEEENAPAANPSRPAPVPETATAWDFSVPIVAPTAARVPGRELLPWAAASAGSAEPSGLAASAPPALTSPGGPVFSLGSTPASFAADDAAAAAPLAFGPAVAVAPSTQRSTAVFGPQPQAAGQVGYVDTTNPGGGTYLGPTYTVPSGGDAFATLYDGYNGAGTVTHSSGTLTLTSFLDVGYQQGSNGTYNLSGTGTLNTTQTVVGFYGTGVFNQSGGTNNVGSSGLYIGYVTGGNGTYTLSGGTLSVTGSTHLGYQGTGVFTQSGGTATLGQLFFVGGASNATGTVNLNGGGTLNVGSIALGNTSGGTSTFNFNGGTLEPTSSNGTTFFPGVLTTANVRNGGAIFNTNGFNVTVAQPLLHSTIGGDNATDGGLSKSGAGTLTLAGANTYNGPTAVNAGTLQAGVGSVAGTSGAFGNNSAVTLANIAGATLDLNGFNTQIGSLTGGGTTGGNVTLGSATLSVGADNTSPAAFAGVISGTGSLTKLGTGTLTLSATNTFTGGLSVQAGTVTELNNGFALASGTVNINSGAVVALQSDSGRVAQAPNTFTGTGTLQKTGAGTIGFGGNGNVNVSLSAGGLIDVEAGTLAGSSSYQGLYTNNQGSLNIAAGATFNGAEGVIRVDALTGAGTLVGGNNAGNPSTTIGVAGGSGTFSGTIGDQTFAQGGVLVLTKTGTGTETLSGNNTYTGPTNINGGTLLVNGTSTGTGQVTVQNSGSVLGGTGTVAAPVTVTSSGAINPGTNGGANGSAANVGTLTTGALTLNSTATSIFDLVNTTTYDKLVVNGSSSLGGTLTLYANAGTTFTTGSVLDLIHLNSGVLTGAFTNAATGSTYTTSGESFTVLQTATDFDLVALTSVPEPATWLGGALLLAGSGWTLRRRVRHTRRARLG